MQKQLIDQIQQALQASEDTIKLQQKIIDSKDEDIAKLNQLLISLSETKADQLEDLPSKFSELIITLRSNTDVYKEAVQKLDKATKLESRMTDIEVTQQDITKLLKRLAHQLQGLDL